MSKLYPAILPKVHDWLNALKKELEERSRARWPDVPSNHVTITWEVGPKYIRVTDSHSNGQRSAYCFLDHEGNIYKTDGWKRPAKGARGHVETTKVEHCDLCGAWLYRR
jgi:hypothetical protein